MPKAAAYFWFYAHSEYSSRPFSPFHPSDPGSPQECDRSYSLLDWELLTVNKFFVGYGEINFWLLLTNFNWTKSLTIEENLITSKKANFAWINEYLFRHIRQKICYGVGHLTHSWKKSVPFFCWFSSKFCLSLIISVTFCYFLLRSVKTLYFNLVRQSKIWQLKCQKSADIDRY